MIDDIIKNLTNPAMIVTMLVAFILFRMAERRGFLRVVGLSA